MSAALKAGVGDDAPVAGLHLAPDRPKEFSFVLLSDRTGGARHGVFDRAVEVTSLLRPDFAIQLGDSIEGYTADPEELTCQWEEFDDIIAPLDVPLFRVPGNHDVSNEMMRSEWTRRHGALHYSFVHHQVLFVVLDTQDPPPTNEEFESLMGEDEESRARLREALSADPAEAVRIMEAMRDWNSTMPARISDDQITWAESLIAEAAPEVRWTFVCMHMPAWQGEGHPGLDRLYRAFGEFPFTVFAGHVHNYRRSVRHDREHIRLGNTGGMWVLSGPEGNFDHVAWVTMTANGPRMANIVLDGVLGAEGGALGTQP